MARTLSIRPSAWADTRAGTRWRWENRSVISSQRWYVSILDAVENLTLDPYRYPEADEAADLGIDLRFKPHGRHPHIFRILFTIDGDVVTIHRVRHAAQDRLTEDDL